MKKITYFYAIIFGLMVSVSSCTVDDLEEERLQFGGLGDMEDFPMTTEQHETERDTVVVVNPDPIPSGDRGGYPLEK